MKQQDRLREMQLAFVGKLMAGLSHEFKNHLAVVKELSGLIEDLVLLEEPGRPTDSQRYRENIGNINQRIAEAAEMCRYMSCFSHRMDQAFSSFSINDVLGELLYLLRRFAWQKQITLVSTFAEDVPVVFNDPAMLQFAIFCIVWPAMESLEKDGRIRLAAVRQDSAAAVIVISEGVMGTEGAGKIWQDMLPEVLSRLGAELSIRVLHNGNKEMIVKLSSLPSPKKNNM